MKRFWLFAGTDQPAGGMGDYQEGGQQINTLLKWINENKTVDNLKGLPFTWFEIVDVNTGVVKVKGNRQFTSNSIINKGVEYYSFNMEKEKWEKLKKSKFSL